jgi:hypothetical protein
MRSALVVAVAAVCVGACTFGPYGLRRRGTPLEDWPGGTYIGAECNQVMCLQDDANEDYVCPRERVQAMVRERILMGVCMPRKVTARRPHGNYLSEEQHRFRQPDLAELHEQFDDRRYTQLEAALMATTYWRHERGRDRHYLRTVYAYLVTDPSQLAQEVSKINARIEPGARDELIRLVGELRSPPMVADGVSELERYVYFDVPRQVIDARQADFRAFAEEYAALDRLVAEAQSTIANGTATTSTLEALDDLRHHYMQSCEGDCLKSSLPAIATETIVRLHIALGDLESAAAESELYRAAGSFRPTLATAIWGAQNDAREELAARESEAQAMLARGMSESVVRQRLGVYGRVRLGQSVFAVPITMPDHVAVARRHMSR